MKSRAGSRSPAWLAPLIIGLLIVLTVAAFGWLQRLKREPLVIDRVEYRVLGLKEGGSVPTVFSPNGDCQRDRMAINFRTTKSDTADVEIIGRGGNPIRTLARNRFFKRYREHVLIWDGRTDDGRIPMTGKYRVRVTMNENDRVLYLPGRIRLHKYSPRGASSCPDQPKQTNSVKEPDKPSSRISKAEAQGVAQ